MEPSCPPLRCDHTFVAMDFPSIESDTQTRAELGHTATSGNRFSTFTGEQTVKQKDANFLEH